MSYILTQALARQAVNIVRPTIKGFLGSSFTGIERLNFHIVILDPAGGTDILYEESFGDVPNWPRDYAEIARGKARLALREGKPTGQILADAPWLFETGDVRYAGGVTENGLVVAGSGLQAYFDAMISWMVLSAIQGLCCDQIARIPSDAPAFFE